MRCTQCRGEIGEVLEQLHGSPVVEHDVHVLAVVAAARDVLERQVDCPLGAMVLDEAARISPGGRTAIGRAAERLVAGEARVLSDPVFLNAALSCCVRERARGHCPLVRWFERQRIERPASTMSVLPVMKDDSSQARNRIG